MDIKYIKTLLKSLGYTETKSDEWLKKYKNSKYSIAVDIKNNNIEYGEKIKLGDKTTSSLSIPENLVVLECVNRLLEKGYQPNDLYLEKKWQLGRTRKSGKADINVSKDGKTLLIIECKTADGEYKKEITKMEANGGQLFSYLQQDRDTGYLCLYASKLNENSKIVYKNAIVKIEDRPEDIEQFERGDKTIKLYQKAKNNEQLYSVWKETFNLYFHYNGIFDDDISAYSIDLKPLKRRDLKELESSAGIFNKFAEILRHNNISDKSNAFNKVLSLFLCKVVDEDKNDGNDERVLDFQVIEGENTETLIDKLQALYKEGMDKYLNEDIVYYSDASVEKILNNFPKQTAQKDILDIFQQVKYYTNQEFAFKEIHNKELFNQNSRILKEVIKLFQYYKFKYTHKEQILGDFFELLLSLGVKQSEGQFFTPTPITKFIVSSIPIRENVLENLENRIDNFLPTALDYACGSGHFLTEAIDEIQQVIDSLDETKYYSKINEFIRHNKYKTFWAENHIYGIEKDYRLARTSQIACLLNGDGEANIIFGDGLETPQTHRQKVPSFPDKFDIIIANPPYSVKAFKNYLTVTEDEYSLLNSISEKGKEIETLFIEQTKKLLKTNGIAGIILPSSILKNTGLYSKTREIILEHFEIPAIVELGSKTFIATGTNTIILFLKRRDDKFKTNRQYIAEDFIYSKDKKRKMDFIDSQLLLKKFAEYRELDVSDYRTLLDREPNDKIKNWDLYKYYREWFVKLTEIKKLRKSTNFKNLNKEKQDEILSKLFYEKILEKEYDKFYFFLCSFQNNDLNNHPDLYKPQKTVIIKTGAKDIEKAFLGYEKSERNGFEGIDFDPDQTKLFNESDFSDETKANSYIRKVLLGKEITEIADSLKDHIKIVNLTDCLTFDNVEFEKKINTKIDSKVTYESKHNLKNIGSLVEIQSGLWTGKKPPYKSVKVLRNTDFLGNGYISYENSAEIEVEQKQLKIRLLKDGDVLIEKSGGSETQNIGRVVYCDKIGEEVYSFSNFTSRLRPLNNKELLPKYLWTILNDFYNRGGTLLYQSGIRLKNLDMNGYKSVKIPIPPINIQKRIIKEIETIEKREEKANKKIKENITKKEEQILSLNKKILDNRLQDLCEIKSGGTPSTKNKEYWVNGKIPWLKSEVCNFDYINYSNTFITKKGLENSSAKRLKSNTVMVALVGATKGKTSFLNFKATTNQNIAGLYPLNQKIILPKFLYYSLKSHYPTFLSLDQYQMISVGYLKDLKINVPSITIQKKIVSSIEQLEKRIEKLENSIANVEQEKKEILSKNLE